MGFVCEPGRGKPRPGTTNGINRFPTIPYLAYFLQNGLAYPFIAVIRVARDSRHITGIREKKLRNINHALLL